MVDIEPREIVEKFIQVRETYLLIPRNASGAIPGIPSLVEVRAGSSQYAEYMEEAESFMGPGRGSDCFKAHLRDRLSWEFKTGWSVLEEVYKANGILLGDLGIKLNTPSGKGSFRFYESRSAPSVEGAYFVKYLPQLEAKKRVGLLQQSGLFTLGDFEAWDESLGRPRPKPPQPQPKKILPVLKI